MYQVAATAETYVRKGKVHHRFCEPGIPSFHLNLFELMKFPIHPKLKQ
jgi:hypothetical protein